MQEIGGIATIESLPQVGLEGIAALTHRTATILVGIAPDNLIKPLAVGCRHILHIVDILQTPLNLKRGGPRLDKFQQMVALVHVFQREQITVALHLPTLAVDQRELHAAELGTLPTVGAAAKAVLRGIAEARVTDTQSTMHEDLKFDVRHLAVDLGNLFHREFTGKDNPRET